MASQIEPRSDVDPTRAMGFLETLGFQSDVADPVDGYLKSGVQALTDANWIDVTGFGNATGPLATPQVATNLFVSSSDSTDSNSFIQVEGTDLNGDFQKVLQRLNNGDGQTKTQIGFTAIPFKRISRLNEVSSFNHDVNQGTWYVYEDDTVTAGVPDTQAKIWSVILPEAGRDNNSIMTVPKDKRGLIVANTVGGNVPGNNGLHYRLMIRPPGRQWKAVAVFSESGRKGSAVSEPTSPQVSFIPLIPNTDIRFQARADSSPSGTTVAETLSQYVFLD